MFDPAIRFQTVLAMPISVQSQVWLLEFDGVSKALDLVVAVFPVSVDVSKLVLGVYCLITVVGSRFCGST